MIAQVLEAPLDAVQRADVLQRLGGQFTLIGDVQVVELATGMRQAADLGDALAEPRLVAGVVVTHQLAPPVAQEGAGVFARPTRGEVVDRGLQVGERCAAVRPHIGPVGFLLARGQHGHRGLVGVQHRLGQQCGAQSVDQGLQAHTAGAHPLGQRGTRDRQARPAEDAFLAVQGQMIGVLGDEHLGQQPGGGEAFVDHLCRHRRLDQRLALLARPLATDVALHRELTRHVVQLLADVLADALERTATTALRVLGFVVDQGAGQLRR